MHSADRYDAFISYSHAVDDQLAPKLQSALHRFARKWYERRALRTFRDKTGLSATPELWADIERAMSQSRYFVLMASPEAARSHWVQREVDWWIDNRSTKTMLIVLTAGELSWDRAAADVAIPARWRERLTEEPLYVDLRWARHEEHLSLRHPQFRAAIVDLAAPLHNIEKDELDAEDLRQHRRFKAVAWTAACALVLLTVFAGAAAWQANQQLELAKSRLVRSYWDTSRTAKTQGRWLESLQWSAEALGLQPAKPVAEAILLDAMELEPAAALGAILEHPQLAGATFNRRGNRVLTWGGDHARTWIIGEEGGNVSFAHPGIAGAAFSPNDQHILTWGTDRRARIWDVASGNKEHEVLHEADVEGAVFARNNTRIASWTKRSAILSDLTTGARIPMPRLDVLTLVGVRFTPDSRRILVWGYPSLSVRDATTGVQVGRSIAGTTFFTGARFDHTGSKILAWKKEDSTAGLWTVDGKRIGAPLRHDAEVLGGRFNRDSSRVLTWSLDDTARIWNAATGSQIGEPIRHGSLEDNAGIYGAVFNADETEIVTWGIEGANVWNAATGEGVASLDREIVEGAAYSPDGRRLVTWTSNAVQVWNAATSQNIGAPLLHNGPLRHVVFSPDGTRILTSSSDGTARLWLLRPRNDDLVFAHKSELQVQGARFSPDEASILTWGKDHTARLWDSRSGRQKAVLEHTLVEGAMFSPDGDRILSWGYERAILWDTKSATPIGEPFDHNATQGADVAGAFSPDGARVVTWSTDHTARIWDARNGSPIGNVLHHEGSVTGGVFNCDASRVLTWSEDNSARIWSAIGEPSGPPLRHGRFVTGAAFSADERRILTWSEDGTASVWDAATGAPLGKPFVHARQSPWEVVHAAWSRTGQKIVTTGRNGETKIWSVATGNQSGPTFPHDPGREVTASGAAFDARERYLVTWGNDTARIWDVVTGKQAAPPLLHQGIGGAVFNRDDTRVLTWGGDGARLWEVASGRRLGPVLRSACNGAVFSRDESRILTSCGEARLWRRSESFDVPPDEMKTRLAFLTGTELDAVTGEVRVLDAASWRRIRATKWAVP